MKEMPGFNAEFSLFRSTRIYYGKYQSGATSSILSGQMEGSEIYIVESDLGELGPDEMENRETATSEPELEEIESGAGPEIMDGSEIDESMGEIDIVESDLGEGV